MLISGLTGKKILILGFGREGQDSFLFLRKKFPKKVIGIADQKTSLSFNFNGREKHTILHLGKNYLTALKTYDVIIKSPGIPTWKIAPFLKKGHIVISQTEMFFEQCPGMIIGITGTKGKSTTATLIHAVLKGGGVRSRLIGNIGEPVLSYLKKAKPEDIFVYELSSFQLENLKRSPHIAVLLNIYPEHLDHHGSFAKYAWAKANIAKHQTAEDFLIYNAKSKIAANIAKLSKAQKLPFSPARSRSGQSKNLWIASTEPAKIIGSLFGISKQKINQAIGAFKPLEHRLERVGKYREITFYNDSLATIPEATIAAIDALGPKVHTLIAGGFDRGLNMKKLGKKIKKSNIKILILFPTTGKKILAAVKKPPRTFFAKTMEEAVKLAYLHTPKERICLMSPAASSFNMFKDYQDRGEQFKKFVHQHGKEQ